MKYFSLFSGIGGFELGIQQAYENNLYSRNGETKTSETKASKQSVEATKQDTQRPRDTSSTVKLGDTRALSCIGYSEIDKYAIQVYQKHFPNHKNYGDITKINERTLPDFDLIVGGFPCQSFSIAGKRKGFDDTRGTLFFEIARIVRFKKPRLLLLENVKGLLSHDGGRTFFTIISTLDELGYDLQWSVLNSKNFGVPQNRERVFIIGHLRGTSRPQVFPFRESDSGNTESQRETRSERKRVWGNVASTLASRDYKGGNNLIQLNQPKHSNDRLYDAKGISPTLNTMQGGMRQPFIKVPEAVRGGYTEATIGDSINLSVMNSKTRRGRVGKQVAQTLDTGMQQHTLTPDMKIRRLTPLECLRLQGFPDDWFEGTGISDSQKYKCCGNAVTVNVISAIVEKMLY